LFFDLSNCLLNTGKVYQDIKIEGSILAFSLSLVHPSDYYSTASAAYSFFKEQSLEFQPFCGGPTVA